MLQAPNTDVQASLFRKDLQSLDSRSGRPINGRAIRVEFEMLLSSQAPLSNPEIFRRFW